MRLLARLSGDVLGRRLRRHLADNGVDLSCAVDAAEPSSLAIVVLADDGSAEYDFRVDGTADWQWTDDELVPTPGRRRRAARRLARPHHAAGRRGAAPAGRARPGDGDGDLRPQRPPPADGLGRGDDAHRRRGAGGRRRGQGERRGPRLAGARTGASPRWPRTGSRAARRWSSSPAAGTAPTPSARRPVRSSRPGIAVDVVDTVGAGDSFMGAVGGGAAPARPARCALPATHCGRWPQRDVERAGRRGDGGVGHHLLPTGGRPADRRRDQGAARWLTSPRAARRWVGAYERAWRDGAARRPGRAVHRRTPSTSSSRTPSRWSGSPAIEALWVGGDRARRGLHDERTWSSPAAARPGSCGWTCATASR